MRERPILFSDAMVRAILSGQKTQTRRVVKRHPLIDGGFTDEFVKLPDNHVADHCPYGQPGDRLWVREAFQPMIAEGLDWPDANYKTGKGYTVSYRATDGRQEFVDLNTDDISTRVRPSIHMPRWASRLLLEIVSVHVERLQDISEADAKAEGIERTARHWKSYDGTAGFYRSPVRSFRSLWHSINGAESWDANPWVWVIEFRRAQA